MEENTDYGSSNNNNTSSGGGGGGGQEEFAEGSKINASKNQQDDGYEGNRSQAGGREGAALPNEGGREGEEENESMDRAPFWPV